MALAKSLAWRGLTTATGIPAVAMEVAASARSRRWPPAPPARGALRSEAREQLVDAFLVVGENEGFPFGQKADVEGPLETSMPDVAGLRWVGFSCGFSFLVRVGPALWIRACSRRARPRQPFGLLRGGRDDPGFLTVFDAGPRRNGLSRPSWPHCERPKPRYKEQAAMSKRGNGEGSISRRKNGGWMGQYIVHTAEGRSGERCTVRPVRK